MKHLLLSSLQLGQLLKSARKRMPLNQHELGARVGLSQTRISQMEREPHTIALDQLLTLTSVLKRMAISGCAEASSQAGPNWRLQSTNTSPITTKIPSHLSGPKALAIYCRKSSEQTLD